MNQIVGGLNKHFKLDKVFKYVFDDNELDHKTKNLNDRIRILESLAHPPQEYICCRRCGCEIAKTKKEKKCQK